MEDSRIGAAESHNKRPERVVASKDALALIAELRAQYGEILFSQSSGCCDGSVPLCCEMHDFHVGDCDVLLGIVGGAPFYMHKTQYTYTKHAQLILDIAKGNGNEFSLEYGTGVHFVFELRLFSEAELAALGADSR